MVAYRSAVNGSGRHMQVLTADGVFDGSLSRHTWSVDALQGWQATYCPLSTTILLVMPQRSPGLYSKQPVVSCR